MPKLFGTMPGVSGSPKARQEYVKPEVVLMDWGLLLSYWIPVSGWAYGSTHMPFNGASGSKTTSIT